MARVALCFAAVTILIEGCGVDVRQHDRGTHGGGDRLAVLASFPGAGTGDEDGAAYRSEPGMSNGPWVRLPGPPVAGCRRRKTIWMRNNAPKRRITTTAVK